MLALLIYWVAATSVSGQVAAQAEAVPENHPLNTGHFQWRIGEPLLAVDQARLPDSPLYPWIAVKDPSIVRFDDRWHLFCTLRKEKEGEGRIRIGYVSFEDWSEAQQADWSVLELTPDYHGAPQVFYFVPHQKWYLIYQAADSSRDLKYGPCFSTNVNIQDASGWTKPAPLYSVPDGAKAGLDFWVICDAAKAHLFFTSLDGRMWRAETRLEDFPDKGWSTPEVALQADIFEASHTYAVRGRQQFLTVVEAQAGKRRYFKLFTAHQLDGTWSPLATSRSKPLVSPVNVVNQASSWATSYSHGEFIRAGYDQNLEIEPDSLQLLFQGANDEEYQRGNYGQIPWRLGLLNLVDE